MIRDRGDRRRVPTTIATRWPMSVCLTSGNRPNHDGRGDSARRNGVWLSIQVNTTSPGNRRAAAILRWSSDESLTWHSRIRHIGPMSFVPRSGSAMTALAALLLPSVMGAIVLVHVATEGHHHAPPIVHDSGTLMLVVHGHRHEPGTPVHQHTVLLAKAAPLNARLSFPLAPVASLPAVSAATSLTSRPLTAPADLAHGPPRTPEASLILRI